MASENVAPQCVTEVPPAPVTADPSPLMQALSKPENQICADCGFTEVSFFSMTLGVVLCEQCCQVHQKLPNGMSKTISMRFVAQQPPQVLQTLIDKGNLKINTALEPKVLANMKKPVPSAPLKQKEDFIFAKYVGIPPPAVIVPSAAKGSTKVIKRDTLQCKKPSHKWKTVTLILYENHIEFDKEQLDISACLAHIPQFSLPDAPYGFEFVWTEKKCFFKTDTLEDATSWIDAIMNCIKH